MGIRVLFKCKCWWSAKRMSPTSSRSTFSTGLLKSSKIWGPSDTVSILVRVYYLRITAVYGSLQAMQHVSFNLVCMDFKTRVIRSTIAVAVRECLSAYAFTTCSLSVMTYAASLSKGGENPSCSI